MQMRDFEFGFQIHVIFDVGVHAIFGGLPILAEQYEDGKEDGFK